jgi:hypothetical protein
MQGMQRWDRKDLPFEACCWLSYCCCWSSMTEWASSVEEGKAPRRCQGRGEMLVQVSGLDDCVAR